MGQRTPPISRKTVEGRTCHDVPHRPWAHTGTHTPSRAPPASDHLFFGFRPSAAFRASHMLSPAGSLPRLAMAASALLALSRPPSSLPCRRCSPVAARLRAPLPPTTTTPLAARAARAPSHLLCFVGTEPCTEGLLVDSSLAHPALLRSTSVGCTQGLSQPRGDGSAIMAT